MTEINGAGGETAAAITYQDEILPDLAEWTARTERCALVTLIAVDGNAPRAVGAQMAVSETGNWSGYISGGCIESAIALEAVAAIKKGHPRLVRYGKGSPYFDIRLPCGSGLDVFIQPIDDAAMFENANRRLKHRQPFVLELGLISGALSLRELDNSGITQSSRNGQTFTRVYLPALRCLVIGTSPIAVKLCELASCSGFATDFFAGDLEALPDFPHPVNLYSLAQGLSFETDPWTAALLAFHDHEQELPVLLKLLRSECFFVSAIGSRNAHRARRLALLEAGVSENAIDRIQSPAGLFPGLKSAPLVALSILAQIVSAARQAGFVS